MSGLQCSVCGGVSIASRSVLWPKLVEEWQLSPAEARYVDRQQGDHCTQCGCNLRAMALANALRAYLGTSELLLQASSGEAARRLSLLEINEAGNLTPFLKQFGRYVFGAYPEVDIHSLPFQDGEFDLVVHSDTLEHVPNPVHALQECRRVLKPGGALCFTVPTIVGRMSRDREGLPYSYHGDPATSTPDYAVRTEFGADAWTYACEAGFEQVSIHCISYPAAIAYMALRG